MLRKLITVIGSVIMLAGLGASASAQASTRTVGEALVQSASARPDTTPSTNCNGAYYGSVADIGNGDWGWDEGSWLEFHGASAESAFCTYFYQTYGLDFEIVDPLNGKCLAWDSSNGDVAMDTAAACRLNGGAGNAWDDWTWGFGSNTTFDGVTVNWTQLENLDNGECLYDYLQKPAIFSSCNNSNDRFEWFYWS